MRTARLLSPLLIALAAAACARQPQTSYILDPQTGQPVPVVQQYSPPQQYAGPEQYVQAQYPQPQSAQTGSRGLFGSPQSAQLAYAQPQYAEPVYQPPAPPPQAAPGGERGLFNSRGSAQAQYVQPQYAEQVYQPPAPPPQAAPGGERGLFNSRRSAQAQYVQPQYAQPQYAQAYPGQSYVLQYRPPAPALQAQGGPYVAAPYGYAYAAPGYQPAYTLDAGDKLRVSVFGQEGISGSYMVDAGGNLNLPLIGAVPARGYATEQLAKMIGERLKQGYVREPHVTVSVESYRPFFILGEVTTPGQYPYVPNMTAESAIAIAGGFAPRAKKQAVELTRNAAGQRFTGEVPLNYPLQPGDTVVVKERWF